MIVWATAGFADSLDSRNDATIAKNATIDVATNVLPSYFVNYAGSSLSVFKALLQRDTPKTYNEILSELPSDQVVVVTGEEDNAFRP